ncbi:hypothetical protein LR48_Vigan02g081000 [Vigna angularis]|uniref:Uncharacterized protein n=1 Tax=Phaseolus angularis TaxID=3914 RepID=A0A0L9TVS7_PHAAN|nr:hypothetical protein LR48_Vigan02g081000 [Vigna angularis]
MKDHSWTNVPMVLESESEKKMMSYRREKGTGSRERSEKMEGLVLRKKMSDTETSIVTSGAHACSVQCAINALDVWRVSFMEATR